jgi:tetratricopeptide (TPR) repeat protein
VLKRLLISSLILSAAYSPSSWAWKKVTPTQVEYNAWPDICKSSQFLTIPPDNIRPKISERERKVLWASGGWHYCTGLLKVRRAELMPVTPELEEYVKDALKDINVSLDRIDKREPWAAEMATVAARGYRLLSDRDKAMDYLEFARKQHPSYVPTYSVLARFEFDDKDYVAAIEILQSGIEATEDPTGELHYFLGLAQFYSAQLADAKQSEQTARGKGYPLQGLARKLTAHEAEQVAE